jgi:hypothetical protein
MHKSKFLFATAVFLAAFSLAAQAKLYKWVDKEGVTHYGEVVPPEFADQDKVEFDKGRKTEIKKQEKAAASAPQGAVEDTPDQIAQKRRDQALLGTYTSEDEIDQARDQSLAQIDTRIEGIQLQMKSAQSDLDGLQREKTTMEQGNNPQKDGLLKQINRQISQTSARLERLKNDLIQAQDDSSRTKARFASDKQRFRELMADKNK